MSLRDAETRLARLFAEAGAQPVDPPLLQPADAFLDLLGQDILSRAYFTTDPDGRELCLRPDFTIPVAQAHIARGGVAAGFYSYYGPVFRHRPDRPHGSVLQAGVESFGRTDAEAADADLLALAFEAARLLNLDAPQLELGDPGLFAAFLTALDLPKAWSRRLKRHFGRADSLKDDLDALTKPNDDASPFPIDVLKNPDAARALIERFVVGATETAGRSASEIAGRMVEKAVFAAGVPHDGASLLKRYFDVEGEPRRAFDALTALARDGGLSMNDALDRMARRLDLMEASNALRSSARFSTAFGRGLDYYTGMVFELRDPKRPSDGPIVGGGRYDRLLAVLGAREPVLAVGFSVWPERAPLGRAA